MRQIYLVNWFDELLTSISSENERNVRIKTISMYPNFWRDYAVLSVQKELFSSGRATRRWSMNFPIRRSLPARPETDNTFWTLDKYLSRGRKPWLYICQGSGSNARIHDQMPGFRIKCQDSGSEIYLRRLAPLVDPLGLTRKTDDKK